MPRFTPERLLSVPRFACRGAAVVLALGCWSGLLRADALEAGSSQPQPASAQAPRQKPADAALQCVSTTADGALVAAGAADGRVFIWKAADGKLQPVD